MITLNLFNSIKSRRPTKTEKLSLPNFLDFFRRAQHAPLADKMDGNLFTMCICEPRQPHIKDNIQSVSGIVLDIDQPQKNAAVVELITRLEATG